MAIFKTMNDAVVKKILSETKHGYDMVSKKFSQTRKHFWRGLEWLGDFAKDGDNIFDYGCGNGRLLEMIGKRDIRYLGVDISQQLIEDATEHYGSEKILFKKITPGQDSLTLPNESFNTIYSIAVFHHIPGKELREKTAKELYNKLKPEGYLVVTVWNLWQKKYFKKIWKNWLRKIKGESELDWNDCRISFTDNEGKKFHRYHHAFTKGELKKLFKSVGFQIKSCKIINGRNIVLVGKK